MDNNIEDNQSFFDDATNIKLYFFKLVRVWYLFVIALVLSLGIAFFYLQYQIPVYGIKASLLVKQESGGSDMILPFSTGRGRGGFQQFGQTNLSDEIAILKSSGIIEETVRLLDDNVSYFANEELFNIFPEKNIEIFSGNSPFQVEVEKSHPQLINALFRLEIKSESSYILSMEEERGWLVSILFRMMLRYYVLLIMSISPKNINLEREWCLKITHLQLHYVHYQKIVITLFGLQILHK